MGSLRTALGVVVVVVLAVACDAAPMADGSPAPSSVTSIPTSSSSDDPGRVGDLEALAEAFTQRHPDPPDLDAELADLRERADGLTDDQFLAEVMDLTAGRQGDGHSGVFPIAQPDLELWPLQLYDFDDGWRVVAAMPPHEALVGGAVGAVGGLPVDAAAARVAPLVSADDDASLRGRLPQLLVTPAVLRGVGLEPTLTVDGDEVQLDPVPVDAYAASLDLFDPLVCPPLPRGDAPLWAVDVRGDAVVVVRFGRTMPRLDGRSSAAFAGEVRDAVDGVGDPARLVVDLRDNPGGENAAYAPLLHVVQEVAAAHAGAVHLLVNRCTFSAAALLVAEVLATTDVTVVGETMGGTTRLWGDARTTTLPDSGIVVHVATRWHDPGGASVPVVVEPDVPVPVTWADRVAGRDPALEAALDG